MFVVCSKLPGSKNKVWIVKVRLSMQRNSLTCTAEHKRSDNSLAPLKKVIYFLSQRFVELSVTVNMQPIHC